MLQEVTGAKAAEESLVNTGCEAVMEEAVVIEVTEAQTAPESLVQEERESVVEEAIVTKEVT